MSNDVMSIGDLIKNSLYSDDELAALEAEGKEPPADQAISTHFLRVLYSPNASKEAFLTWLRHMVQPGSGVFRDVSAERLTEGPSYIELGAWVGDQTDALMVMALGQHHGLWKVITPQVIRDMDPNGKFADMDDDQLAGVGFVLIEGFDPAVLAA